MRSEVLPHYLTENFPLLSIWGRSKNEEIFGLVTTEISDLFVRLYKIAPLGSEILNLSPLPIHSSQLAHNTSAAVFKEMILKQSLSCSLWWSIPLNTLGTIAPFNNSAQFLTHFLDSFLLLKYLGNSAASFWNISVGNLYWRRQGNEVSSEHLRTAAAASSLGRSKPLSCSSCWAKVCHFNLYFTNLVTKISLSPNFKKHKGLSPHF